MIFYKMHHLGNDFLITYDYDPALEQQALSVVPLLADRHSGVGFDQLIFLKKLPPSTTSAADFSCTIFNADGSAAEQCGNGICCVARLIYEKNLAKQTKLIIATNAGLVTASINNFNNITVKIGLPYNIKKNVAIHLDDGSTAVFTLVSLGNHHAIAEVITLDATALVKWGVALNNNHELFPAGVNLGFMQVLSRNHLKLLTYERGVGLTLACGTNACAAVVSGIVRHHLESPVTVEFARGSLLIEWLGSSKQPIFLTGAAKLVFSAKIDASFFKIP